MWLGQNTWRDKHIGFCTAAGVTVTRLHDMRHAAATLLMEQGVPVKVIADILGHQSVTTTMEIYQHSDTNMQRTATDALAGQLFEDEEAAR
jgi:integrase